MFRRPLHFATSTFLITAHALVTACSSTPPSVVSKELARMPIVLSQRPATARKMRARPIERELALEPKFSDLAREWKLHPYELRKQSMALEQFLRYGRYPSQYCKSGRALKIQSQHLCRQVSQIVASYSKNKKPSFKRKTASVGSSKSGRRFKLNTRNLAWAQRQHFDDLISSITPMSTQQILDWTPRLLKHHSCPRNLSAASIRKLENFLPANEVKVAMEKLYAHASFCLKPNDAAYSVTHFRQALLRTLWGDQSRARISASLAPLGAKGEELPRALFWAGLLQVNPTQKAQYWSKLVTDHPLSFHALNAHHQQGHDPLADAILRPIVNPSRDSTIPAVALSMRWFEALILNGKETAASRLAFWTATNFKDDLSLGNIIYITHLKADKNTHQASFGFVWNQIERNPENMNEQTLKLLFPLPYWEVFQRNSGSNDPMLLVSVAKQESAFNPQARSPANARGLLQLLPATAHALTGTHPNLYAPEVNARLGSKFLSKMITKFGSVELALAAYNAGPMRIPTWRKRYPTKSSMLFIDLIPYRETRNYVANILRNNYWYSRLYEEAPFRSPGLAPRSRSTLVSSLIRGTRDAKPAQVSSVTVAAATGLDVQAR